MSTTMVVRINRTEATSYAKRSPDLVAGVLCLDFVNTVTWRNDPSDQGERLTSYKELLLWCKAAQAITSKEKRAIEGAAKARPDDAIDVLNEAIALREALASLYLQEPHQQASLEIVNDWLERAPARHRLTCSPNNYQWQMDQSTDPLLQSLWPILWSGVDLLVSSQRERISSCAGPRCGWLFLDLSRNRSRRWCSMADCGNRAKAQRHYARITKEVYQ